MRLLLPPSEGKSPGGRGAALEPDRYGNGPLGEHRRRLCALVESVARGDRVDAVTAFQLPPATVDAALTANASVTSARTRTALDRYAGVVYDGLAYPQMTADQRRVAHRSVLIFSGLFGVVGAAERVPDYRVPAGAILPGIGGAGASWRPVLTQVMPERLGRTGLILDLRSTDYASMWRPDAALAVRTVTVRALSPRPDGTLGVVSYSSKHAKGRLAKAIIAHVATGARLTRVEEVAALWTEQEGGAATVTVRAGRTQLDLVTLPTS